MFEFVCFVFWLEILCCLFVLLFVYFVIRFIVLLIVCVFWFALIRGLLLFCLFWFGVLRVFVLNLLEVLLLVGLCFGFIVLCCSVLNWLVSFFCWVDFNLNLWFGWLIWADWFCVIVRFNCLVVSWLWFVFGGFDVLILAYFGYLNLCLLFKDLICVLFCFDCLFGLLLTCLFGTLYMVFCYLRVVSLRILFVFCIAGLLCISLKIVLLCFACFSDFAELVLFVLGLCWLFWILFWDFSSWFTFLFVMFVLWDLIWVYFVNVYYVWFCLIRLLWMFVFLFCFLCGLFWLVTVVWCGFACDFGCNGLICFVVLYFLCTGLCVVILVWCFRNVWVWVLIWFDLILI